MSLIEAVLFDGCAVGLLVKSPFATHLGTEPQGQYKNIQRQSLLISKISAFYH